MAVVVSRVSVEKIKPAPYNPRVELKPGDYRYEHLKKSLDKFGCVEPLVWNRRTGHLVGGHQRLNVLLAQGATEVEVSVVDLSLEDEKALNVALNKITGDWDDEKLADLLSEFAQMPDFDFGGIGFLDDEVSDFLNGLGDDDSETEVDEDDFDADETAHGIADPITQPGNLIELGPHRLLCGDSSKAEAFETLLNGRVFDLIYTDPPYNVNYYGGNRPTPAKARPKQSRQWMHIYCDNQTQEEYEKWLQSVLGNLCGHAGEGAPFYVWNGHRQFGPMHQILSSLGLRVSCVITWAKPNFAIGYGDYNQQTEFCLYGWRQNGGSHRWYGPTNESTLWEEKRDCTKEYRHPTQKPVALAARALRNSSRKRDLVADAFLGSGTTLMAAQQLGRVCYGIEIAPHYCDAIAIRYASMFGWENVPAAYREKYECESREVCHA